MPVAACENGFPLSDCVFCMLRRETVTLKEYASPHLTPPSHSPCFSHFHSLFAGTSHGTGADIDSTVKDYRQTIYPELHLSR